MPSFKSPEREIGSKSGSIISKPKVCTEGQTARIIQHCLGISQVVRPLVLTRLVLFVGGYYLFYFAQMFLLRCFAVLFAEIGVIGMTF